MKLNLPQRLTAATIALGACSQPCGDYINPNALDIPDTVDMDQSGVTLPSVDATLESSLAPLNITTPQQAIHSLRTSTHAHCIELGQANSQEFRKFENDGFYTSSMANSAYNAFQKCLKENGLVDEVNPATQDKTMP